MIDERQIRACLCFLLVLISVSISADEVVFPGADQNTPARAQYFSWINNTNEGATEAQTLVNLEFFDWLNRAYGMQLDIYAFDAGAIDGKRWYGTTASDKFKRQFPNNFDVIHKRAAAMGIRLGIWGGPDGFGEMPDESKARIDMMVGLCEKYDFELFKFDTVAGDLRDSKQSDFAQMMTRCREHSPDLVLLNHRINLGPEALPHATTFLWEGKETYTDVHMVNSRPAIHHRAGALERGLPPQMSRLTEDHGVCLSSALDYWDDELILQAFNRSLILSPQIYCNPWLLSDVEFPKLARIFNLARQYKDILVNGLQLDESQYGPFAVARGNDRTRLLSLRNLSWTPQTYTLTIDSSIGIAESLETFEVRRYHPGEEILGKLNYADDIEVVVPPFRSVLIRVSQDPKFGIDGIEYEVVRDIPGKPLELKLLGAPGSKHELSLHHASKIISASLDGVPVAFDDNKLSVEFDGTNSKALLHRHLGELQSVSLPEDAEALYEATVFAADNNALEVRSLARSGSSKHAAVKNARNAFFNQALFTERAIWDRNLFDGDASTAFAVMDRWRYWWNNDTDATVNDGGFRLDIGKVERVDSIILHTRDEAGLQPAKSGEGIIAEVSSDLRSWTEVRFIAGKRMQVTLPNSNFPMRYFRIKEDSPHWISEVEAYDGTRSLNREQWRASNLFGRFTRMKFENAWQLSEKIADIAPDSYLAVAIAGETGNEGVYAAMRVDGEIVGAPDRAPSYPANTWELQVKPVTGNYTYYLPLKPEWSDKQIDIVVLGTQAAKDVKPEVWLTRKPKPLKTRTLILER